jgi:hypothetical protein
MLLFIPTLIYFCTFPLQTSLWQSRDVRKLNLRFPFSVGVACISFSLVWHLYFSSYVLLSPIVLTSTSPFQQSASDLIATSLPCITDAASLWSFDLLLSFTLDWQHNYGSCLNFLLHLVSVLMTMGELWRNAINKWKRIQKESIYTVYIYIYMYILYHISE